MTTPKYKDLVFDDYTLTKDGVLTQISTGKTPKMSKRVALYHNTGRKAINTEHMMGYTFFDNYNQKLEIMVL